MASTEIRVLRKTVSAPLGEKPMRFEVEHGPDEHVVHVEMRSQGVPARRRTTMDWYITAYVAKEAR